MNTKLKKIRNQINGKADLSKLNKEQLTNIVNAKDDNELKKLLIKYKVYV